MQFITARFNSESVGVAAKFGIATRPQFVAFAPDGRRYVIRQLKVSFHTAEPAQMVVKRPSGLPN
jgi:hypothetical protein